MFFPIGEIPEELKQEMMRQVELNHMNAEDRVRAQTDLMERLSADDLTIVRDFVRNAVADAQYGSYLNGWMSHILQSKHKICQYCGETHESMEDMLIAHAPKEKPDDQF